MVKVEETFWYGYRTRWGPDGRPALLEKDAWPTNRALARGRKKHREGYPTLPHAH